MREGKPEYLTYFYFFADGKFFEELSNHKLNSVILGQFEHAYTPENSTDTYGARIRHTYYDQGFDFSELGLPLLNECTGQQIEIIPYFSRKLSNDITEHS